MNEAHGRVGSQAHRKALNKSVILSRRSATKDLEMRKALQFRDPSPSTRLRMTGGRVVQRFSERGFGRAMRLCSYAPMSLAIALLLPSCATRPTAKMMDLKITHARILDGTGAPWFYGDIGVRGDPIVTIRDLVHEPAKLTIVP